MWLRVCQRTSCRWAGSPHYIRDESECQTFFSPLPSLRSSLPAVADSKLSKCIHAEEGTTVFFCKNHNTWLQKIPSRLRVVWHTCICVAQEVVVTLGRSGERVLCQAIKTNMSAPVPPRPKLAACWIIRHASLSQTWGFEVRVLCVRIARE